MTASCMTRFAAQLESAIHVVEAELAAFEARDLSGLEERGARKAALAGALEREAEGLVPELTAPEAAPLRARIAYFRALLARDAQMLERLGAAAGEMLREIGRVRDRHGLGGLYGKSGKSGIRRSPLPPARPLDRNI